VSDAALLASHLDGVLILVRSGKAVAQDVSRAREQMERVGGKVLGGIFNAFGGEHGGYGNYGYSKYGYGGYSYRKYGGYYQQDNDDISKNKSPLQVRVLEIINTIKNLMPWKRR